MFLVSLEWMNRRIIDIIQGGRPPVYPSSVTQATRLLCHEPGAGGILENADERHPQRRRRGSRICEHARGFTATADYAGATR
jgi:hypothetical protein